MKFATSFRLSQRALDLTVLLSDVLGIGRAAVLELAIRELAKKHGIKEP